MERTTTRTEHMAWCKGKALEYLPRDPAGALASMLSDLRKHPDTEGHAGLQLTMMLMMGGFLSDAESVRKHIEGFN